MHKINCQYCNWTPDEEYQFLGQAKHALYRHFDESPVCSDKFEKDNIAVKEVLTQALERST